MNPWMQISATEPAHGVVVETKIDYGHGERNVQNLKRGGQNGRMWFYPNDSMYVYYTPTHWRKAE